MKYMWVFFSNMKNLACKERWMSKIKVHNKHCAAVLFISCRCWLTGDMCREWAVVAQEAFPHSLEFVNYVMVLVHCTKCSGKGSRVMESWQRPVGMGYEGHESVTKGCVRCSRALPEISRVCWVDWSLDHRILHVSVFNLLNVKIFFYHSEFKIWMNPNFFRTKEKRWFRTNFQIVI